VSRRISVGSVLASMSGDYGQPFSVAVGVGVEDGFVYFGPSNIRLEPAMSTALGAMLAAAATVAEKQERKE
jgi:hypothetical protein